VTDQEADRFVRVAEEAADAQFLPEPPDAVDTDWRLGWE
jgi:hypothetical protein